MSRKKLFNHNFSFLESESERGTKMSFPSGNYILTNLQISKGANEYTNQTTSLPSSDFQSINSKVYGVLDEQGSRPDTGRHSRSFSVKSEYEPYWGSFKSKNWSKKQHTRESEAFENGNQHQTERDYQSMKDRLIYSNLGKYGTENDIEREKQISKIIRRSTKRVEDDDEGEYEYEDADGYRYKYEYVYLSEGDYIDTNGELLKSRINKSAPLTNRKNDLLTEGSEAFTAATHDDQQIVKEILLDIQKNTAEHKSTNFLCLEEILKKLNVLLKKQIEMSNIAISQKSERQQLFQQIYELKKQVADKAFNSLTNKDFAKFYIKTTQENKEDEKEKENIKNKNKDKDKDKEKNKNKNTSLNKIPDNSLEKDNINCDKDCYEIPQKFHTKNENVTLFLTHLNALEKSIYTFTSFCRNTASKTYADGQKGLTPLEQKIYLFLQNPETMRLVRDLEKKLTKIKSICVDI